MMMFSRARESTLSPHKSSRGTSTAHLPTYHAQNAHSAHVSGHVGGQAHTNYDESPNLKRSSHRRSMLKKSRPHSWHSTLQKGFNRARSRSSGRDNNNRNDIRQHRASTHLLGGERFDRDGKKLVGFFLPRIHGKKEEMCAKESFPLFDLSWCPCPETRGEIRPSAIGIDKALLHAAFSFRA